MIEGENKKEYRNIYIVVIVLLILSGLAFSIGSFSIGRDIVGKPSSWFLSKDQSGSSFIKDVTGKIHLTLLPVDESALQGLYFYDFKSKTLERGRYGEDVTLVTSKSSPIRDSEFAFAAHDLNGDGQIFIGDLSSYGVRQITSSRSGAKLLPQWSPGGEHIAFSVQNINSDRDSLIPENWKVYITNLDGVETFVSDGVYPKWSPNGEYILFMKNDGLYTHNTRNGIDDKVWGVDDELMYTSMKLNVSPNGKMIALSDIDKGEVAVIDILSWSPFNAELRRTTPSYSFWPTFSSDSRYLAVQEVNSGADVSNPRVVVYDLDTFEHEVVLNLNGYIQEAMFISDWQK